MPISVLDLFAVADPSHIGVVRWGQTVPSRLPGVYCVAATADTSARLVDRPTYNLSPSAYTRLLAARPHFSIDGRAATKASLADRLGRFWIPNEPVLYIGLAGTSLQNRVQQFYSTRIGERSPHAGGWWLKTMTDLDKLYVHFAECEDVEHSERLMLQRFAAAVRPEQSAALFDPQRIAPFANVSVRRGSNKRHGLSHYKSNPDPAPGPDERDKAPTLASKQSDPRAGTGIQHHAQDFTHIVESQPVTDSDRARSNLRIPSLSKFAFPATPGEVPVIIDGQRTNVRWRPNGHRSGTLGLGVNVMRSLQERNERISIGVSHGIYFILRR